MFSQTRVHVCLLYCLCIVINTQKKFVIKTHLSKKLNWKEKQLEVSKTSFLIF